MTSDWEVIKTVWDNWMTIFRNNSNLTAIIPVSRILDNDDQVLAMDQFPAITIDIETAGLTGEFETGFDYLGLEWVIRSYHHLATTPDSRLERVKVVGLIIEIVRKNVTVINQGTGVGVQPVTKMKYVEKEDDILRVSETRFPVTVRVLK